MNKKLDEKEIAKASGTSLPVSTKQSIEICNFIRNKKLEKERKARTKARLKKVQAKLKTNKEDIK